MVNTYKLMIFTIFFSSDEENIEHLETIAKLGGTEKVFKENSVEGLNSLFQSIAINPSFGLKIK